MTFLIAAHLQRLLEDARTLSLQTTALAAAISLGSYAKALLGAVGILSLLSVAAGSPAFGQGTPPANRARGPLDILDNCPRDHRIEFRLPSATLYVDPRWLGPGSLSDLYHEHGGGCPNHPVDIQRIDFGPKVFELLGIRTGLGRKLWRLGIYRDLRQGDAPPNKRETKSSNASITTLPVQAGPTGRAYEISYPAFDDEKPRTVIISCGGDPKAFVFRTCSSPLYVLSQTELPVPDPAEPGSADPETEPGALLQFDSRFRAWLTELQRPP